LSRRRIALVGLGMALKPHAESCRALAERLEVAWAFSPSEERRHAAAERYGFPVADSLERILDDGSVGIVTLMTPPNTHLDLVRRCAAAGKHVLLEKPLEISTARAEELVAACRAAGVTLGVVLQHRFRPSGLRLREVLDEGSLGALVGVSASILNWHPQAYYDQPGRGDKARDGGGVLLTQGIHTLDLMISLLGLPAEAFAYAATSPVHRMETEDLVAAGLRYPNGALGTIDATTTAFPGFPEAIRVIGEAGTAVVTGASLAVRWHDGRSEDLDVGQGGGAGADPMAFPSDYHRALIADFLDALDQDRAPAVTGEEALKVHRLIDALLTSAAERRPVALEAT